MRRVLKHYIIDTTSLYIISQIVRGMVFEKGIETLLITGGVLTAVTLIAKPIINILLLPINLVTFGLFKWVAFAISLFLVTLAAPGFKLTDFIFAGYDSYWFSLPAISLSGVLAFIAFSFLISMVSSLIYWIFK